ncbi:diacylglycerol kinase family protein [Thalassobacillus devorans]|uniref:diacylglycerol kinase family protein n=1 Tax=Thalassobacillus devorans TaxID=279813 RepID=UPI00048D2999|nr:diacylglycerol kinase family protein [Thalassobacillus devorans]
MSSDWNGNKKRGIGFRYAWRGIMIVAKTERNMKFHLTAAVLVLILSWLLQLTPVEWAVILLIIALILTLEMINTSIEKAMDHLAPDIHPAVGAIKDIAAGAVLVASVFSVIIGLVVFLPKLISFL